MRNGRTLKITAAALVVFHFLIVVLHSIAHEILAVKATAAQLAFIFPVIIAAPPVAALLLRKFEKIGSAALSLSMTGSFFFGLYYHFIARTSDHVAHVANLEPAFWAAAFEATAYLLALSELAAAYAGFWLSIKAARYFQDYETRTSI
ncbi:MAG TPA: hypothetical protein VIL74_00540 [Pyrinomonadaceae bacterium]|jgi:hypothetical protein